MARWRRKIGQVGVKTPSLDPRSNVPLAMVDWIENGKAPEMITGVKYVNDTPSLGIQFVRNHCIFPTSNEYVGLGPPTDPVAWKCS